MVREAGKEVLCRVAVLLRKGHWAEPLEEESRPLEARAWEECGTHMQSSGPEQAKLGMLIGWGCGYTPGLKFRSSLLFRFRGATEYFFRQTWSDTYVSFIEIMFSLLMFSY